jgi:peptidoglycan hydrolase-like amidase
MMRSILFPLIVLSLICGILTAGFLQVTTLVFADELDDIEKQLSELTKAREQSVNATKPLEGQLTQLSTTLKNVQSSISKVEKQILEKEKELKKVQQSIVDSESKLDDKKTVFEAKLSSYYITSTSTSPLMIMLSTESLSSATRQIAYHEALMEEDQRYIKGISTELRSLGTDKETAETLKKQLESENFRLASIKVKTKKEADFYEGEIAKAKKYQEELSGKIASLSARQQSLLAERSGSFVTAVGDVPLTDDANASPNYNPGFSPAFGGFSFGGYTHRKGMSQYGAKGRAESGQNSNQILKAYYQKEPSNADTGGNISVEGVGSIDFEGKYLMGIAEMPGNFPKEALKAQAIAARTYAYRYKKEGKSICTTQSCQVYLGSKAANPPATWKSAVEETKGQIIEGVVTYYSSTTGGYSSPGGWDTKCGNQGCWTADAYEKIAKSPWFYKGWYTESYSNTSAKCGRSSPWLKEEEFADIINAWIVRKNGGDSDRILPVTISSCNIGGGGNPFSMSELRDKANQYGGAVTSVSGVSVSYSSGGSTGNVTVQTNRGSLSIPGSEFKETFNLRAPGYISLRSPLYNIEKK